MPTLTDRVTVPQHDAWVIPPRGWRIYKTVSFTDNVKLLGALPFGLKLVRITHMGNGFCNIWIALPPDLVIETRELELILTGQLPHESRGEWLDPAEWEN